MCFWHGFVCLREETDAGGDGAIYFEVFGIKFICFILGNAVVVKAKFKYLPYDYRHTNNPGC